MVKKKLNKQIEKEIQEIMFDWSENYDRTGIVEVVWEDARTLSGTTDYIGIKENGLLQARTIGYLIYEDEKRIAVCGFLFPDIHHSLQDPVQNTAFRDVHIIPKGWIKHVAILKTDWEKTKKFRESNKDDFTNKRGSQ
jgi:hypothetical protein